MNTKVDVILRKLREDDFRSGFEVVTSDPTTGVTGQTILNTSSSTIKVWYNSAWETIHSLTPPTAQYLLAENSDFLTTEAGDRLILE